MGIQFQIYKIKRLMGWMEAMVVPECECTSYHWIVCLKTVKIKNGKCRTSLVVQWLRLHASNVGGVGGFPVWGTKIPHALQHDPKTWYMLCYMYFNTHKHRLPGWYRGKQPACQCRRCRRHGFNPWVRKICWRGKWQPTPVFLPGKFHGQRSLAG